MHDGQMLFDPAINWNKQSWNVDETAGRLLREQKIRDLIVVGVWNSGAKRHSDYFPQKPFETLSTPQRAAIYQAARESGNKVFADSVSSDKYLKFLVTELKPFIDSVFSTYPDQSHTFIAGSSMGGLISLYAICEYPDVFGGAACLSTHWPGIFTMENNPFPAAFFQYLRQRLPDPATHQLYFDHGTTTLDAMYMPLQQKADIILRQKGFAPANWMTRVFPGEPHSEEAWSKRFDIPLLFLLHKS